MNATTDTSESARSAWQLEFVRLVAFPADLRPSTDQDWWKDAASEIPDDFVSTRKKHTREDRGSCQGTVLSLTVNPSRVEWLVQPIGESGDGPIRLPTLGLLHEKVDWFVELVNPWLADSCPPLMRLAFHGKLLQAAATQREGYKILSRFLPKVDLEPNPNDFLLQINRRTNSTVVDGLGLNRVSTWSKLNVAFAVQPGTPFKWPEACYGALELDVNTAPEFPGPLPSRLLPRLFRELASLAVEIAERGDVAENTERGDAL